MYVYKCVCVYMKIFLLCGLVWPKIKHCLILSALRSDGETSLSVRQCWRTVAAAEPAAAHECITFPHPLLLQVGGPEMSLKDKNMDLHIEKHSC